MCAQCVSVAVAVFRHGPHEEEEVVYERLPSDIASRQVLLMDPLVGTGRTACRAVEVRHVCRAACWSTVAVVDVSAARGANSTLWFRASSSQRTLMNPAEAVCAIDHGCVAMYAVVPGMYAC